MKKINKFRNILRLFCFEYCIFISYAYTGDKMYLEMNQDILGAAAIGDQFRFY